MRPARGFLFIQLSNTRHGIITGVDCYPANQRESDLILEHLKGQPCKFPPPPLSSQ